MHIGKIFRFEAAHRLLKHTGKCYYPHGHSYKLEIEIEGSPHPHSGMIVDFEIVSNWVNKVIIDKVDHKDLNKVYENMETTAENLADRFYHALNSQIKPVDYNWSISKVKLWETDSCYAEAP